ncbi:MAG: polyketide cyclase / dehydrase and lipid transport [Streptomycetaceae bacterium]|nr:MAG: polyketide cyclase / dehydrase and lipid transport [Streptomycetaceae bacterium]
MSDSSRSTITIDAPLAAVTEALFTLENYPEWSSSIKSVEVVNRDDQGRVTKVKMTIDAGMMKDRVILDYDWSEAPARLSFSLDDADLLTGMDGAYIIKSIDEESTEVTYELTVSLSMPIPAMMRQKAEKTTIDQALAQLKATLEA